MSHILVATLGDSPIVVTSMFYLLTEQEQLTVDKVILLHPEGDNRENGCIVIDEGLRGLCAVEPYELPFEDTYTEDTCFIFLQCLFALLNDCQKRGDTVYLSLAGGRKNMSALTALVAPFYKCIKGLYHVIDKSEYADRRNFKSIQELTRLYESDRAQLIKAMRPELKDLRLVPIPLENALRVEEPYLQKILTMTPEQLQELWEKDPDEADRQQFILQIVKPNIIEPPLQVYFTEKAKEEYEDLKYEADLAKAFVWCFERMRFATFLAEKKHGPLPDPKRKKPYPCYVYKRGSTKERPFFHTEPGDIAHYPQNPVDSVIIERLAWHRRSEILYDPPVEQLMETKYQKGDKLYRLEEILNAGKRIPSVLIVPMGTQPMVATQLYTLLTKRERRDIQKVILVYPEGADEVFNSVQTTLDAFDRKGIRCQEKPIEDLMDIASRQDCEQYQIALEQIIKEVQETDLQQNPDWRIDLALSGGRKGMAALALFAAQRTQLHEVYHTLIANKELDRRIEFEMGTKEFGRLKSKEKDEKLFLDAYKAHEADFRLFKVPIGPLVGNN